MKTVESASHITIASGLNTVIDTLVNSFDKQIDALWHKLVEARRAELTTIDQNFRLVQESINALKLDRYGEVE